MRHWWQGLSARRRWLVTAVAVMVGAGAVLVGVRVAGDDHPERDGPVPVLLVPGYGGSRAALSTLADRLRRAGRDARVLTLPGDGTGDLNAQARLLDEAAGGAPVDVIGYSAGGVVARLWVDGTGARLARRVVTLGSPLHGTEIAAAGGVLAPGACPVACQQLSPGSALLAEISRPVAVPWLSVWTENDQTVVPPDSARLPGAVNVSLQQVCPDAVVTHAQLPTDPLVTGIVLRALGDATMSAPSAADCTRLRASS
ncbi:lipase [Actinophytocola sp.]|uniref:esterase/lipase family protein n=1 Tax=Actinophytocola sp. TaxID=1872138 RepID=UPI002ED00C09